MQTIQINSQEIANQQAPLTTKDPATEKAIDSSKGKQEVVISLDNKEQNKIVNPYIEKYENALGPIIFNPKEAIMGKLCCCCLCCAPRKLGAPAFPNFQNKLEEIREKPFKRIQLLINPTSGGGNGQKIGDKVIKQLQVHKIPFKACFSASVLYFYDFVETFNFDGEDLLMVCGGDGTIYMTLNILAKRQAIERKLNEKPVKPYPFAVIPGGTGNDLCNSLGFGHNQIATYVEKYIKSPKVRKIDIVRARIKNEFDEWKTYYYSCQSGIGFAGRVDILAKKMNYMFRLKYKAAAFRSLLSPKEDIMSIYIDGNLVLDKKQLAFMSVSNVPMTGGGFRACPIAQVNDGLLDLIIISAATFFQTSDCLQEADRQGAHVYNDLCKYYRGREIRVLTHSKDGSALDVEMDGEDYKCTEAIYDIDQNLAELIY